MPKAKPSIPPVPTEWIDNEAQNAGCHVQVVYEEGKTPRKRRHRDLLIEALARPQEWHNRHGAGRKDAKINQRQCNAGLALFEAWAKTQRSPEPSYEYFQRSPDFDEIIVNQTQNGFDLARMMAFIPKRYSGVVIGAVLNDHLDMNRLDELRAGLNALADGLGMR